MRGAKEWDLIDVLREGIDFAVESGDKEGDSCQEKRVRLLTADKCQVGKRCRSGRQLEMNEE